MLGTYSYVAALTTIPFGLLSDRMGRRTLLIAGLIIFVITPLLYPFASDPYQLIFVRAVHGLSSTTFTPAAIALVIDTTPPEKRGEALGWYTTANQAGFVVGPALGGFLESWHSCWCQLDGLHCPLPTLMLS